MLNKQLGAVMNLRELQTRRSEIITEMKKMENEAKLKGKRFYVQFESGEFVLLDQYKVPYEKLKKELKVVDGEIKKASQ